MGTLRPATIYVACVGIAATLIAGYAAASLSPIESNTFLVATLFATLIAAASYRPIHFGFRLDIDLTTVVIVAAALSLDPQLAIVAITFGVVAGQALQRTTTSGLVFNSGQVILQAAAAAGILAAFGWNPSAPQFAEASYIPVIALSMMAVFLVNTVLVSTVVGLQARTAPWLVWRDALNSDLLIEQASQFALGLAAAVIASVQPWILPLLVVPGLMLYVSASRQNRLRFQTEDAINALADLVDQRDPTTADHSRRVAIVARELATRLQLPSEDIDEIERSARVHDLGKLVIDISLLTKSEPLCNDEWRQFQRHPADGANVLAMFPEFSAATSYVRHHHERWDGHGYPDGVGGEDIPLGARILAVADALDAMSSVRPYRPPLSSEKILAEFTKHSGQQWDALVVDALFELIDEGVIGLANEDERPQVLDGLGSPITSS